MGYISQGSSALPPIIASTFFTGTEIEHQELDRIFSWHGNLKYYIACFSYSINSKEGDTAERSAAVTQLIQRRATQRSAALQFYKKLVERSLKTSQVDSAAQRSGFSIKKKH